MTSQHMLRLRQLDMHNFRGFERLSVHFDSDLTIFIGINGAGKTTILDCVAKFFIYFEQRITQKGFSAEKIPFSKQDIYNNAPEKKTINTLSFDFDEASIQMTMGYEKSVQIESYGSDEEQDFFNAHIHTIGEEDVYRTLENLPVLMYYRGSSVSFGLDKNILEQELDNSIYTIYESYLNNAVFDFTNFFKWFDKEQKISMQKGDNTRLTFVKEAIAAMLSDTDANVYENLQIEWGYPDEMVIYKNGERLLINQLSSGEKNLIAIVADLAYRLSVANPKAENPLEGTGIVLIDEIDLHLHPQWQRKVVGKLREIFPNVQLVITTHSPLVLNHLSSKHILCLENGAVYSVSDTYGQSIEVVLEDTMKTNSSKYKEDFDNLYLSITQNDISKSKELLNDLELKIEGKHPEITKINALIKKKELLGL